ncbi:hypothetical protein HY947_02580, partial [Candidatus Gottesmanbacteria bacterium]|nr:hypothetical protein [Candidatus Gottesmanbacteria bacterium]
FIFLCILSVIAALVVGVNVKRFFNPETASILTPTPTSTTPTSSPSEKRSTMYKSSDCGISFSYPASLSEKQEATNSAILLNPNDKSMSLLVACQKDIPKPPLAAGKIESIKIASSSANPSGFPAKRYHDSSQKDGSPIDTLIFPHPTKKMDVFIATVGFPLDEILSSLVIE